MPQGKLVKGNEAVAVEYEIQTIRNGPRRETNGTLRLLQTPIGQLAKALYADLSGANLITEEGQVQQIEFQVVDNMTVRFMALPPSGVVINP